MSWLVFLFHPLAVRKITLVDLQADVLFNVFIATWLCSTFPAAVHWKSYQWEKVGHPNAVWLGLSGTDFAVKFFASEKSLRCYPASFTSTSGHLCATCSCSGLCCVTLWPELQENTCPSVCVVWCEWRMVQLLAPWKTGRFVQPVLVLRSQLAITSPN